MDTITSLFFIGLTNERNLEMYLLDIVTTYLYCSFDINTFMRLVEGLILFELNKACELYLVKLQRSLYGLKKL